MLQAIPVKVYVTGILEVTGYSTPRIKKRFITHRAGSNVFAEAKTDQPYSVAPPTHTHAHTAAAAE